MAEQQYWPSLTDKSNTFFRQDQTPLFGSDLLTTANSVLMFPATYLSIIIIMSKDMRNFPLPQPRVKVSICYFHL
ncbi:hypothetical protein [Aquibacillus kalidii]|uniref:hypothetical protein n=1 Tax=Aquibacillus kalidii TaxID=2762597 RepID=UPI00164569A1|nr:hypothetical protein [Aquibacillus kalidii]